MSRDSNAMIRQKAHQVLESLLSGNERFRKVRRRVQFSLLLRMHCSLVLGEARMQAAFCISCVSQTCKALFASGCVKPLLCCAGCI